MTHSTGIYVSEELSRAFGGGRATCRALRATIRDYTDIVPDGQIEPVGSASDDFGLIKSFLRPKTPCYVLYRLDEADANNQNGWLFLSYVPDGSPVKDRMTYAASRECMKRELGVSQFKHDMFGTEPGEFSWASYQEHIKTSHDTSSVMTDGERLSAMESQMAVAPGASKEYVHSVKFPISTEAVAQLKSFAAGSAAFVQLSVDVAKETIELSDSAAALAPDALAARVPANEPRFNLFRWDETVSVFVYSCPDKSPVKLKMLYSTVKSVAVSAIEGESIAVAKKIEVQDPAKELTAEALGAELGAGEAAADAAAMVTSTFAKPSRPGAGGRRLIRTEKK